MYVCGLENINLFPGIPILAIAPHPDDIALSCGGFIRKLIDAKISLLTCFSRSLYAPLAQINDVRIDDVYKLRSLEDETYSSRIGASRIDLKFDDVSIRYANREDWFQKRPQLDEVYYALTNLINEVNSVGKFSIILCPLAVGYNVDHYYVYEAVRNIALPSQSILYYEDLPYGARIGGADAVSAIAEEAIPSSQAIILDISEVIQLKLEDISIYRSQIYPNDLKHVLQYGAELGGLDGYAERLWVAST